MAANNDDKNLVTILAKWLPAALCLVAAYYMGSQFLAGKADADSSLKWPMVNGVIEEVSVHEIAGKGGKTYDPLVHYRYTCSGKQLDGDTISFPKPSYFFKKGLVSFQQKYLKGAMVPVYYDPKAPANSCLEPGENGHVYAYLWWTVGLVALSVVLPCAPIKRFYEGERGRAV